MKRKPVVAGSFYPGSKDELNSLIESCFKDEKFGPGKSLEIGVLKGERNTLGGICPHAGYVYSGAATAHTIQAIFKDGAPDTFIVLGNTHSGYSRISIMPSGQWITPLGDIEIDSLVANAILSESNLFINDEGAFSGNPHGREHNIEVQLPFIQYGSSKAGKKIQIVPIKIGSYSAKNVKDVGEAIGTVINNIQDKDIVVIASSDMFHEGPKNQINPMEEIAKFKKRGESVRNSIKVLDWEDTLKKALDIGTICGPQTITTAIVACKTIGATKSDILNYYTSYEKLGGKGPSDYCVAYLSAVFRK